MITLLHEQSETNSETALVKGDSLSYSIAAASVLAKVTRSGNGRLEGWPQTHPWPSFDTPRFAWRLRMRS